MKCKITLQERLKDLRVAHNLNLEELAKLTDISKSTLGNYENDDYKEINHGNLVTLAQFYNVSTDYLFRLTKNKNHPNTDLSNLHLSDDIVDLLLSGLTVYFVKLQRMISLRSLWLIWRFLLTVLLLNDLMT